MAMYYCRSCDNWLDNDYHPMEAGEVCPDCSLARENSLLGNKRAQKDELPRDSYIHIRVSKELKAAAVEAAKPGNLTDWIIDAILTKLEKESC